MRTLKKGLSCLLVLNLLLGGGLIFAPKADALQGLLFPFVTTETGKFTFITITNDGAGGAFGTPVGAPANNLHFTYAMKPVPIANTAGCVHFDADGSTTAADMMIFEVNRKVTGPGGTTVLFEPGVGAVATSFPVAFPVADNQGFLIVEPNAPTGAFLFGTAAIVDTANGLTASYSTNFFTSNANLGPNPDFTAVDGGADTAGPPIGVGGVSFSGFKNFTWYPTSVVTSSWFILPLSNRSTMAPAGGGGIRWAGRAISDHLPSPNIQGAYDLDERFFSGGNVVRVRCFGVLTRASFLNGPSDISTAGGGHTFMTGSGTPVVIAPATDTNDAQGGTYVGQPFTALKFQSTTALGALRSAVHQEPDHTPCFNPTGAFPTPFGTSTLGFSCAGY